jgi:hypothetical protein
MKVTLDDGSVLRLEQLSGIVAWNTTDVICFETSGTWTATAGELRGDHGEFRLFYNSIQSVMHLTES